MNEDAGLDMFWEDRLSGSDGWELEAEDGEDGRWDGFLDRWDDDPDPYSGTYSEE